MYIHEETVVMMVKQRMDDAMRYAEQRRALRLARASRPSTRVRLGMVLIRFGHWMMGQSTSAPGTPVGLPQAQS